MAIFGTKNRPKIGRFLTDLHTFRPRKCENRDPSSAPRVYAVRGLLKIANCYFRPPLRRRFLERDFRVLRTRKSRLTQKSPKMSDFRTPKWPFPVQFIPPNLRFMRKLGIKCTGKGHFWGIVDAYGRRRWNRLRFSRDKSSHTATICGQNRDFYPTESKSICVKIFNFYAFGKICVYPKLFMKFFSKFQKKAWDIRKFCQKPLRLF